MSLSLGTVPKKLPRVKRREQSREDISWHVLAGEDRVL